MADVFSASKGLVAVDADTVDTPEGERVRLQGVNAFERGRPEQAATLERVTNKFISDNPGAQLVRQGQDVVGRTVGDFVAPSGQRLSQELAKDPTVSVRDFSGGGGDRDLNLIGASSRFTGLAPGSRLQPSPALAPNAERTIGQEFGAGIARGIDTTQAGLYGAVSALGDLLEDKSKGDARSLRGKGNVRDNVAAWLQRIGDRGYMRNIEQMQGTRASESLKEVVDADGKLLRWAAGAMGEALPSMVGLVAGAGTGAAAGVVARSVANRVAARKIRDMAMKKLRQQGLNPRDATQVASKFIANLPRYGAHAGGFATGAGVETGHIFEDAKNQFGDASAAVSIAGGSIAGALDYVGAAGLLKFIPGSDAIGKKQLLGKILTGMGLGTVTEGATEMAQELVAMVAKEVQNPNVTEATLIERISTDDNKWALLSAAAAGALFGGTVGAGGGLTRHLFEKAKDGRADTTQDTGTEATTDQQAGGAPAAAAGSGDVAPGSPGAEAADQARLSKDQRKRLKLRARQRTAFLDDSVTNDDYAAALRPLSVEELRAEHRALRKQVTTPSQEAKLALLTERGVALAEEQAQRLREQTAGDVPAGTTGVRGSLDVPPQTISTSDGASVVPGDRVDLQQPRGTSNVSQDISDGRGTGDVSPETSSPDATGGPGTGAGGISIDSRGNVADTGQIDEQAQVRTGSERDTEAPTTDGTAAAELADVGATASREDAGAGAQGVGTRTDGGVLSDADQSDARSVSVNPPAADAETAPTGAAGAAGTAVAGRGRGKPAGEPGAGSAKSEDKAGTKLQPGSPSGRAPVPGTQSKASGATTVDEQGKPRAGKADKALDAKSGKVTQGVAAGGKRETAAGLSDLSDSKRSDRGDKDADVLRPTSESRSDRVVHRGGPKATTDADKAASAAGRQLLEREVSNLERDIKSGQDRVTRLKSKLSEDRKAQIARLNDKLRQKRAQLDAARTKFKGDDTRAADADRVVLNKEILALRTDRRPENLVGNAKRIQELQDMLELNRQERDDAQAAVRKDILTLEREVEAVRKELSAIEPPERVASLQRQLTRLEEELADNTSTLEAKRKVLVAAGLPASAPAVVQREAERLDSLWHDTLLPLLQTRADVRGIVAAIVQGKNIFAKNTRKRFNAAATIQGSLLNAKHVAIKRDDMLLLDELRLLINPELTREGVVKELRNIVSLRAQRGESVFGRQLATAEVESTPTSFEDESLDDVGAESNYGVQSWGEGPVEFVHTMKQGKPYGAATQFEQAEIRFAKSGTPSAQKYLDELAARRNPKLEAMLAAAKETGNAVLIGFPPRGMTWVEFAKTDKFWSGLDRSIVAHFDKILATRRFEGQEPGVLYLRYQDGGWVIVETQEQASLEGATMAHPTTGRVMSVKDVLDEFTQIAIDKARNVGKPGSDRYKKFVIELRTLAGEEVRAHSEQITRLGKVLYDAIGHPYPEGQLAAFLTGLDILMHRGDGLIFTKVGKHDTAAWSQKHIAPGVTFADAVKKRNKSRGASLDNSLNAIKNIEHELRSIAKEGRSLELSKRTAERKLWTAKSEAVARDAEISLGLLLRAISDWQLEHHVNGVIGMSTHRDVLGGQHTGKQRLEFLKSQAEKALQRARAAMVADKSLASSDAVQDALTNVLELSRAISDVTKDIDTMDASDPNTLVGRTREELLALKYGIYDFSILQELGIEVDTSDQDAFGSDDDNGSHVFRTLKDALEAPADSEGRGRVPTMVGAAKNQEQKLLSSIRVKEYEIQGEKERIAVLESEQAQPDVASGRSKKIKKTIFAIGKHIEALQKEINELTLALPTAAAKVAEAEAIVRHADTRQRRPGETKGSSTKTEVKTTQSLKQRLRDAETISRYNKAKTIKRIMELRPAYEAAVQRAKQLETRDIPSVATKVISELHKRIDLLQGTNIVVYGHENIKDLIAKMKKLDPTGLLEERFEKSGKSSAVVMNGNTMYVYVDDKQLSPEDIVDAAAHEFGHVVFRQILLSQAQGNTEVWQRIQAAYKRSGDGRGLEEWFADQVAVWNRKGTKPENILERMYKATVDALTMIYNAAVELIGAGKLRKELGFSSYHTVEAFLDALVLRSSDSALRTARQAARDGVVSPSYDMNMFQLTARSNIWSTSLETDIAFLNGGEVLDHAERISRGTLGNKITDMSIGTAKDFASLTSWVNNKVIKSADGWLRSQYTRSGDQILAFEAFAALMSHQPGERVRPSYRLTYGNNKHIDIKIPKEAWFDAVNREYGLWSQGSRGFESRFKAFEGRTEILDAARELLQREQPLPATASAELREAYNSMREVMDEFYEQYVTPNLRVGKWLKGYFPRVYDAAKILQDPDGFNRVMTKYMPKWTMGQTVELAARMSGEHSFVDAQYMRELIPPGMLEKRGMRFDKIPAEELAPYMADDTMGIIRTYFHQTIKRVEYDRRFPKVMGKPLIEIIGMAAVNAGADTQQLVEFKRIHEAYLGRLGADLKPSVRKFMSAIQTYQNVRLLPLAVLSSFIDLANPTIRGNPGLKKSWAGLRAAMVAYKTKGGKLWDMAVTHGVISDKLAVDSVSQRFNSPFMSEGAQRFNDKFFRAIGMQQWTNFTRLYALEMGRQFIMEQAQNPGKHGARWLEELGTSQEQVKRWMDAGGNIYMVDTDRSNTDAYEIQVALNRYVSESVFLPNAAQRPSWASDPKWMLLWHLKQFTWSFTRIILGRALREAKKRPELLDKLAVALPFLMMVPLAMMSMEIRDWLKYELLPWREGKPPWLEPTPAERGLDILRRSGVLGPLDLVLSAEDTAEWGGFYMLSFLGPSATQLGDAMSQNFSQWITKATPVVSIMPEERALLREALF